MSTAQNPFPATVRNPAGSSDEGSIAPPRVLNICDAEKFDGYKITVTKVRAWWQKHLRAAGWRVCTIFPNDGGSLTVHVRPIEDDA
jgi:hypothetical protein